jgi:hypothetical protein
LNSPQGLWRRRLICEGGGSANRIPETPRGITRGEERAGPRRRLRCSARWYRGLMSSLNSRKAELITCKPSVSAQACSYDEIRNHSAVSAHWTLEVPYFTPLRWSRGILRSTRKWEDSSARCWACPALLDSTPTLGPLQDVGRGVDAVVHLISALRTVMRALAECLRVVGRCWHAEQVWLAPGDPRPSSSARHAQPCRTSS